MTHNTIDELYCLVFTKYTIQVREVYLSIRSETRGCRGIQGVKQGGGPGAGRGGGRGAGEGRRRGGGGGYVRI